MKRHSVTARRPIDENEQNQLSEKKRLKVVHEEEDEKFPIENQLVAGCSNSIKESMECITSVEDTFLNNGAIKKDDHLSNNVCENGSIDADKSNFNNFSKNSDENLVNGSSANSESDDLCENSQINNLQTIPQEQTSKNLQTVPQEQTIKILSHASSTFVHIDNSVPSSLMQEEQPAKENTDQISSQVPENESENSDLKIQISEKFTSSDFSSEKVVQQSVSQEESSSSQEVSTHDMTTKEFIEKVLKPQKKPKDFEIENIASSDLEVTQLVGHADVIFSVAVDEDFVISSSADTTIKVWNVHGGKEVSSFAGHSDVVTSIVLLNARHSQKLSSLLKWGQVSRIVVSASLDCHIKLWSLLHGKELLSMYTYNGITSMDYFPCELGMIIGTDGGKLELWDIVSAKVISSVCAHEASVSGIKVEEPYIYTCSGDGTVRVWLLDEKEIQPLYIRRRKEPSSDESFKPSQWKTLDISGDIIYLGDNSNTLKVLDWRMGHMQMFLNQVEFDGICEAVVVKENVLFSTFFDPSSDMGGINVWKLPEFLYIYTLTGDVQDIYSLAVTQSKDKLRIVSGGQQLLVWDIDFTKPSKKNPETFYVTETEPLGIRLNENATEVSRQAEVTRRRLAVADSSDVNKKSWCNIF